MNWVDMESKIEITSINQFEDNVIGFVYLIDFTDGTKYIGKKNLYSTKKIKALKSGKARENCIGKEFRNTGKGFRQAYDVIKIESNWKAYKGSSKLCKEKEPANKLILDYATSKLELTYKEVKYQFIYEVLEKNEFLNDNILGSFYKGRI